MSHVVITVTCAECKLDLGEWTDRIEEKYPFHCHHCDWDLRMEKYPWILTTRIVDTMPGTNLLPGTNPGT